MRGSAAFRAAVAPGGVLAGPWVRNDLWRRARAVPSLDLQFADTKSLTDAVTGQSLVTFTRSSSGTYVGSDGLIKTAATNEPRFDHNPTTGESLGLLVEEQRTNFLLQSDSYDSGNASLNNVTATANTVTAPDGTLTADSITGSSSVSNTKYAYKTYNTTTTGTYTTSVFLKAGTQSLVLLRINDNGGTNDARQLFNLTNGTKSGSAVNGGTATGASSDIVSFGNGWYRCSLTCTFVSALTSLQGASVWFDGYTSSTSTNTFYVWGAQLEAGAFPTSYIPTTTAAATRSADVASISGTAFSSWYRQDAGSLYWEGQRSTTTGYPNRFVLNDGTSSNRIFSYWDAASNSSTFQIDLGAVSQAAIYGGGSALNTNVKTAFGFVTNDAAAVYTGNIQGTDSSLAMPTVNQLAIGAGLSGTHRRLTYFPQRLSNNVLQAITQP